MENVKWATAFQKVFHRIEQINHTTYNHSSFSREIMGGVVNRNTIGNWLKGSSLPGHREDVIKLGITAGYNETEMNELLTAADKNMLYIRDSDKEIVSIFRDAFYIYLTKQDNASCRKALAVIEMLRDEVKEAKNLGLLFPSDCINEEYIVPFYEDNEMLIQTCRDFYENMYVQFHAKYNLTKGVSKIEEGKRKVSVEALAGKWKEVLSVMLYTAFHVHSGKHIENMHIPQRREIITLGLILSYKKQDIDDALEDMHYPSLSSTEDKVESIIIYVLEADIERKVSKDAVTSAKNSLRLYSKLKKELEKLDMNPKEYEWLTNMYPEKPLVEFILQNGPKQLMKV